MLRNIFDRIYRWENLMSEKNKEEDNRWASLLYLSCLSGLFIPFLNILAPYLLWLQKKGDSEFIDTHAKNILNFQIGMTLFNLLLIGLGVGLHAMGAIFWLFYVSCFFLLSILILFNLALMIRGSIFAKGGQDMAWY